MSTTGSLHAARALVYCSAGRRITGLPWLGALAGLDVALVYYGDEPVQPPPTRFFLRNKDFKIPNFIELARKEADVLAYDYYFFIDDDLILDAATLSSWLSHVIEHELDVSQPSLTQDSKADWPHVKHQDGLSVDIDQFVEIQCFCLSKRALQLALPFFFMAKTGTGLDIAIYLLCQRHQMRSAVIHDLRIHHPHRAETQTVRQQFSDFAEFNGQLSRFIAFCFDDKDALDDLTRASQVVGDTRYLFIRLQASIRFMWRRLMRKFRRDVFGAH